MKISSMLLAAFVSLNAFAGTELPLKNFTVPAASFRVLSEKESVQPRTIYVSNGEVIEDIAEELNFVQSWGLKARLMMTDYCKLDTEYRAISPASFSDGTVEIPAFRIEQRLVGGSPKMDAKSFSYTLHLENRTDVDNKNAPLAKFSLTSGDHSYEVTLLGLTCVKNSPSEPMKPKDFTEMMISYHFGTH